jgi:hypothetical protein
MTLFRFRRMAIRVFGALAVLAIAVLQACPALAAADTAERPHWSLDVKGGYFYPDFDQFPNDQKWADFYGDDKTWQVSWSLAYKLLRQVEIGLEGGVIKDRGQGWAPTNGILTGRVEYELYPASAFVVLRGVFSEDQWIAPYIGGGYTRVFYREKIQDQGTVKGFANGYYGKAGIQLLLDGTDRSAANNLYMTYGIHHTWIFFEAQKITAKVNDVNGVEVDLGGVSYLGGLLFEF